MQRILEPELMNEEEQARAYAAADFEEPHNQFIELFQAAFPGLDVSGFALDLGCGPGDIARRFARAFPACSVHGVDGAEAMLRCGQQIIEQDREVHERVALIRGYLPGAMLPRDSYDIVISNSLLHHLANPAILWEAINAQAAPGAPVFIMDLARPQNQEEADYLVDVYMPGEPEILRRDFFNSLLASFTVEEVRDQLCQAGLDYFSLEPASDRHLAAWGRMPDS
ncbi:MAG: class I SAM-dependent methyltransferase [Thermoleophilia bacterium]